MCERIKSLKNILIIVLIIVLVISDQLSFDNNYLKSENIVRKIIEMNSNCIWLVPFTFSD